jgi:peroxidase
MDNQNSVSTLILLLFVLVLSNTCTAQLSPTFYATSCPLAVATITTSVGVAVLRERRMAASLIRLHFHDCFVQGCDASVLLADTATFTGEQNAFANRNSARGFEVIAAAKSAVERLCPGVVSCADILTVAARAASVAVGGPTWPVSLGRRDSTTASQSEANSNLPSFQAGLDTLISSFQGKGLSARDMVALSGSHTIGQAQCATFRDRIYSNGTDIDAAFATTRRRNCPAAAGTGDSNLAPLDLVTPNLFDNNYFRNLVARSGLLQSDQVLFSGGSTDAIVREYINNPLTFRSDFAAAMVRMAAITPTTGQNGIIRRVCSAIN